LEARYGCGSRAGGPRRRNLRRQAGANLHSRWRSSRPYAGGCSAPRSRAASGPSSCASVSRVASGGWPPSTAVSIRRSTRFASALLPFTLRVARRRCPVTGSTPASTTTSHRPSSTRLGCPMSPSFSAARCRRRRRRYRSFAPSSSSRAQRHGKDSKGRRRSSMVDRIVLVRAAADVPPAIAAPRADDRLAPGTARRRTAVWACLPGLDGGVAPAELPARPGDLAIPVDVPRPCSRKMHASRRHRAHQRTRFSSMPAMCPVAW
jgi:hypothetical protein